MVAPDDAPPDPYDKAKFQLALRQRGITDQAVLRAMDLVPREMFVERGDRDIAYADTALAIACGQTISQPFIVAYMTQQLEVASHHRVLEIGTGSGYQAAILGLLARDVLSIERFRTLAERARGRLDVLGVDTVEIIVGDGFAPPATLGTFDRILVTAALEKIDEPLTNHLGRNGVLIAPVGPQDGVQHLVKLRRDENGTLHENRLIGVRFVPMVRGIAREL